MQEREVRLRSGFVMVFVILLWLAAVIAAFVYGGVTQQLPFVYVGIGLAVVWLFLPFGFIVNGPNQARVVQLFGRYVGTLKRVGFFWGNPFYWRSRVSLRVQTFETGVQKTSDLKDATGKVLQEGTTRRMPTKVNDKDGTPIEIAAVVTFRVTNPAEAVFSVDDYEDYIHVQSEAALRTLASHYRYDAPEGDEFSLRGHIDEVAKKLKGELQTRMTQAGIEILDAQISYLAYAPEIASMMLQRQQAGATIAARQLIIEAAVGMVEHALDELAKREVVQLDAERKAAMVSNLLVVLCSHSQAQPVLNTGTLYN